MGRGRPRLPKEEKEKREEKQRQKRNETIRGYKRGVHSLRKAIEEIAKIPTPVTLSTGRKAYAVIYSDKYQQAVKFIVDHFNNGSLAILNERNVNHKPYSYKGSDSYSSNREKASRFMMFDEGGKNGKDDNSSK